MRISDWSSDVCSSDLQLYQIDPAMYEATLKSAEANLRSTKSISDRYKQLVDEQAVSRQEYDTAVANRLESEANLQTARINVRYTKVYAPISGRIGRSSVTEGALVSNGKADAMATLQHLDPIYQNGRPAGRASGGQD